MSTSATPSKTDIKQALALCRSSFVSVGVFSVFVNLLLLTPAFYMLQVYDRVITSGSLSTLFMLTMVVLLMFLTIGGLEWVRSQILVRIGARLESLLDRRVFDASFRQALYTSGNQAQGQAMADLAGVRQFIGGNGLLAFFDAPWLPIYLLVMYWLHPLFGLVGLVSAMVLLALAWLNARLSQQPLAQSNRSIADANAFLVKNLRNAEVIESMGMLDNIRDRWQQRHFQVQSAQLRTGSVAGLLSSVSRIFRLTVQSLVLGLGAYLVIEQRITPGLMIAGSILLGRALAPVDMLIGSWQRFVKAKIQYQRLALLLDQIPQRRSRMSLPAPAGVISAEQVSITPPGSRTVVIGNANFSIERGDVVGVIGPSASGKTSLARALLGIWPTSAGKMRLDGADIYTWDRAELGPHVGYLPQDIELFEGTVSENIARFGAVDPAKVVAAATQAGVHEVILRLPQGYDMEVGNAGSVLSAGQRQRVALARALYGDPQLIVLDEPNSNLDDTGEMALINALKALKKRDATVLVISHRKTILTAVDKLMVLREGKIALYGPKSEVLARMQPPASSTPHDSSAKH